MGRKGRIATQASDSTPTDKETTHEALIAEVRAIYFSLLSDLRVKRKLRPGVSLTRASSLLKPDVKKRLFTAVGSLSAVVPDTETHSLLRDFGDGFADVLGTEIPGLNVKDEFQCWVNGASALMCGLGKEFQALCEQFLPVRSDLEQEFKLSLLEKANKVFSDRLAPSGFEEEREFQKKAKWLEPKPRAEDPKMRNMSLDQLMDFISEAQPTQESQDDIGEEVARFRKRLESYPFPVRRLTPRTSTTWLSQLSSRCPFATN